MNKEVLILEYQNAIDRANKYYFTVFLALNTLFFGIITKYKLHHDMLFALIALCSAVIFVLILWYKKIDSLKKLMLSHIKYLKSQDLENRNYFDSLKSELKVLNKPKHKLVYPNWGDDLLPLICGGVFILLIALAVYKFFVHDVEAGQALLSL